MNKQIVKKEPNRNFRVEKYNNWNEKNCSWGSTAGFVGFKQKEENKQFENRLRLSSLWNRKKGWGDEKSLSELLWYWNLMKDLNLNKLKVG